MRVSDAISRLRYDLHDAGSPTRRWEDPQLLDYLNEGFRDLAKAELFCRWELHVPTNGQLFFLLGLEEVSVKGVWYDWVRIDPLSPRQMDDRRVGLAGNWMTATTTNGYAYVIGPRLRLWPRAGTGGTALAFSDPSISEVDGKGPDGNGYWAALDGTAWNHFLPGDAAVTNWDAANNLLVWYAYVPEPVGLNQSVASKYLDAAREFAAGKALESSDDPLDIKFRDASMQEYARHRSDLIKLSAKQQNSEALPTMRREPGTQWGRSSGLRRFSSNILGDI